MKTLSPLDAITALTVDDGQRLRARFVEAGFTEEALSRAEKIAPRTFDAIRLPLVRWSLAEEDTASADLLRLFQYEDGVSDVRARRAFGDTFDRAVVLGLIVLQADGQYLAPFRLIPLAGHWFLGDDLAAGGEAAMGPGITTMALSDLLAETVEGRVLDLCCGTGTLAIVAAARGAEATGTDLNPRAVALAEVNARLNGVTARFVVSDIFSALGDAHFDLVLCQPPFVMQPETTHAATFLHGGNWGDELALRMIAAIPAHMTPGGRAYVRMDSLVRPKAPLHARLREALGASPVDLLVAAERGMGADLLSVGYATLEDAALGPAYADSLVRYRRHLRALGATESTHAMVVLVRLDDGAAPRFTITLPVPSLHRLDADSLDALFRGLDLAGAPDAAVLRAKVALSAGARFSEVRDSPDREVEPTLTVSFSSGPCGEIQLSESTLAIVHCLQSSASVGEALEAYATLLEAPSSAIRPQALRFVRESLARGMLVVG